MNKTRLQHWTVVSPVSDSEPTESGYMRGGVKLRCDEQVVSPQAQAELFEMFNRCYDSTFAMLIISKNCLNPLAKPEERTYEVNATIMSQYVETKMAVDDMHIKAD